jgi:uncharacterized SAM-binding protein YcdF (DUF218 family)
MSHVISTGFLIPPAVFVWLILLGIWLSLKRAPLGPVIALVASLCLYATSMPLIASYLLTSLEDESSATFDLKKAQAIVVLGGGVHRGPPGEKDSLSQSSLDRVVMAAEAYRRLHVPVAVTGAGPDGALSEAILMKEALDADFSVPVTWVDEHARSTYENALLTRRLLQPGGIDTVVVVTEAAPRQGYHVDSLDDFLPSAAALNDSYVAFHELIGAGYYRLRY